MTECGTYRKRSEIEIRAMRFTGDNAQDALIFCDDADVWLGLDAATEERVIIIGRSRGANVVCKPGDWLVLWPEIKRVSKQSDAYFRATWERADG